MQFHTLAELWYMEGHGPYVWACYAAVFLAVAALVVWPLKRHNNTLQALKRSGLHNEQIPAAAKATVVTVDPVSVDSE